MQPPHHQVDALLRLPEVARLRGRSEWSTYADIRAGVMTRPVAIGPHSVGWPASEVAALNRARIAEASVEELRELVRELHAKRKTPEAEKPAGAGEARPR